MFMIKLGSILILIAAMGRLTICLFLGRPNCYPFILLTAITVFLLTAITVILLTVIIIINIVIIINSIVINITTIIISIIIIWLRMYLLPLSWANHTFIISLNLLLCYLHRYLTLNTQIFKCKYTNFQMLRHKYSNDTKNLA